MAYLDINGARLFYTDSGAGDMAIVFSHSLLFSTEIYDDQIAHLKDKYRCIAYDHRGQGHSEVTKDGYDMDSLAGDAAALIKALGVEKCHFVGLSMGGFVAQRMALDYPDLVRTITILDSSADAEPDGNQSKYKMLNFILRWFGQKFIAGSVMPIMFGQTFLNDPARADARKKWRKFLATSGDKKGLSRAVRGVIEREGVIERLVQITTPTLIIVGEEDVATIPEKSERMHAAIVGSEFVQIPHAGHLSTIDEPDAVNAALSGFLAKHDG